MRATGFFVAQGVVATCAHVLSETRAGLPGQVSGRLMSGQSIVLETVPEWYLRADPGGLDLAFLRAADGIDAPHVLLSGALTLHDPTWAYGHPAGQFRNGQSAGFTYQGPSRLREDGGQWEPHRLTGTPVGGGYSGSPVLNLRTGAVCGMLCTSDEAGSAHMVSADNIVTGCPVVWETQSAPGANARWLSGLSDQQITDGGWLFPGPRLRTYLDAAIRAAADHPYPGVVPGITPPPLTAVYVRQQAETLAEASGESLGLAVADLEKRPAEEILSRAHDCVLIGGPGAGKSSLLRTVLITLARKWQRGEAETEIPVHILAADLIPPSPLPDMIAAGVTGSLSAVGILKPWPPDFFASPPLRGVRWLVLVDGLDEVLDPVARRRVLEKIAGAGRAESGLLYRFIVATRPLPSSEFPSPDQWRVTHYELQLFASDQLTEFAERWFTELRLPEPDQAARGFAAALDRAQLTDPARTPLMATMLCQLFAANQDRSLPAGRSGVYTEFVGLLRSRQYEDSTSGIYAQMQTLLGPYGPAATGPAGRVLTIAMDLIARLAFHRHEGGDDLAVDLLAGWTGADRPRHVPELKWRSFLREILRRSGVLTQRADDFQFIHQTVGEFLAAQYVTADAHRRSAVYEVLFCSWQSGAWIPPSWDESYSRFLVAAWPDKSSLVEGLRHLASDGKIPGCRFIASLVADSALPDLAIAEEAAETLAAVAGDIGAQFPMRRSACEVMAQLHDPRGANELARLAADESISAASRRQAAESLARIGDSRGADLLARQAGPSESDRIARRWAASSLARLGDPRGASMLAAMVAENQSDRADALRELIELDARGRADMLAAQADSLTALTSDRGITSEERVQVSRALARLGDRRSTDLLAALAHDAAVGANLRLSAAETLAEINASRAAPFLVAFAGDAAIDANLRLSAAETLAEINGSRAAPLLAALAAATGRDSIRRTAAAAVARLDGADLLVELAAGSAGNPDSRYGATEALAWINDSRHTSILALLAADPAADAPARVRACQDLVRAGDRSGAGLAAAIAAEPGLDMAARCEAAWVVTQAKDRRASLLRRILTSANSSQRRLAAASLARLAGGQTTHLLEALSAVRRIEGDRDPHMELAHEIARLMTTRTRRRSPLSLEADWLTADLFRADTQPLATLFDTRAQGLFAALLSSRGGDTSWQSRAAEALASLGDPRGGDMLTALAADSRQMLYGRIDASLALGRLNDPRAVELLLAIIRDQSFASLERLDAVEALALVDEPRSVALLSAMATDRSLDDESRHRAGEMLTRLAPGAADALARLASDNELGDQACIDAADALSQLGDNRGAPMLAALASDPGRPTVTRIDAAEALAGADATRAIPLLISMATDRQMDADIRGRAAEALARLANAGIADHLAALAADDALPVCTRIEVATMLARLGDPRATHLLTALATDPGHDAYARRWAADALTDTGHSSEY